MHSLITLFDRFMGRYIGTIFLLIRRDIPRIIGVFAVINFSFGGGLYFALVGHYDDSNVAMGNDNSTRYMHTHTSCTCSAKNVHAISFHVM